MRTIYTAYYRNRPCWFVIAGMLCLLDPAQTVLAHDRASIRVAVPPTSRRTCGAETLYFCLKVLKSNAPSLASLQQELPVGFGGVSASQLLRVAEKHGASAQGVNTNISYLESLGGPSILHVNDNHFIVFVARIGERIIMFDNTIGLFDCPKSWFEKSYRWTGDAIVFGEIPSRYVELLQSRGFFLLAGGLLFSTLGLALFMRSPRLQSRAASEVT